MGALYIRIYTLSSAFLNRIFRKIKRGDFCNIAVSLEVHIKWLVCATQ